MPPFRPVSANTGHARRGQRLDVAVHGAHGHLEGGRQLGCGRPAAELEEQQQLEEAARPHDVETTRKP